jgi:hypothetical protein
MEERDESNLKERKKEKKTQTVEMQVEVETGKRAESGVDRMVSTARANNVARRVLFPHLAQDDDLPQLTRTGGPTLDAELYDLVALALRAHVSPWWSKVSRHDKEFTSHLANVVSHVLRVVEHRIHATDPLTFLCVELPAILSQHYRDFASASSKTSTSYSAGGALTFTQTFHALQAHMAIHPDGSVDETYLRLALEHILDAALPPEDSAAETERSIVRELVVHLLQDLLFDRVAQPWFWMRIVLELLGPPTEPKPIHVSHPSLPPVCDLYRPNQLAEQRETRVAAYGFISYYSRHVPIHGPVSFHRCSGCSRLLQLLLSSSAQRAVGPSAD